MSKIKVRVLNENGWQDYRAVRLAALQESPQAFLATYAEEVTQPEQYWRDGLLRADRLLAERDGAALGVASMDPTQGTEESADLRDLWVTPEERNTGVASRLVQAGSRRGCSRRLGQALLLGEYRERACDRVRQQCRFPRDFTAPDYSSG